MVRAMCGQKVVDRKTTKEQMDILGLKETIDRLATSNGVRWYGHVLRRDNDNVLRVALNLEVSGKRKRGRPKRTWRKQVEGGDREDWFEERGCPEMRQVEGGRECKQLQKEWGKSGHLCERDNT